MSASVFKFDDQNSGADASSNGQRNFAPLSNGADGFAGFVDQFVNASTSGAANFGPELMVNDDGQVGLSSAGRSGGSNNSGGSGAGSSGSTHPAAVPAATLVGAAGGLQINLVWDGSVASAPAAFEQAVIAAATEYTTLYSNKEVINIGVGYGEVDGYTMGSGALGESVSNAYGISSSSYAALTAEMKAGASASAYAKGQTNLVAQAESSLPSSSISGADGYFVTVADMKALGLVAGGSASTTNLDGYIGLASAYPFEYDQTATSGTYDAIGTAEHEISEVMGRIGFEGDNGYYTPLDLFRYSASGVHDTTATSGYFSINNGATNLGTYNNPQNGGDSSDWIPTLQGDSYGDGYAGQTALVSSTDILENAVLGYHLTTAGVAATQTLGLK
jgi:hypothetical protein